MDNASSRDFLYDFGTVRFLAACAVLGVVNPAVRYAGATTPESRQPVPNGTYWARMVRRVVDERQEGMRNGVSTRKFVTNGLFYVQLFAPITDTQAQSKLDQMAELIRNDFRMYQGEECDFTTAEIMDSVTEPAWLQVPIVSNYQYRQYIS